MLASRTSFESFSSIDTIAIPSPGEFEVVIENEAVAADVLDLQVQHMHSRGFLGKKSLNLGQSVAGTIVATGSGITKFHVGQRVIAHCHALKTGNPDHAGSQDYTVAPASLTAVLPDSMPFEPAATLPLSISTAAAGLYEKCHLGLTLPALDKTTPRNGQSLLVIGGASPIGAAVVQLAVASGLRIVATAAVRDHALVRTLGTDKVIDADDREACDKMWSALADSHIAGIYDACATQESAKMINYLLERSGKTVKVCCSRPLSKEDGTFQYTVAMALSILRPPHAFVCDWIWGHYVPAALQSGDLKAVSAPLTKAEGFAELAAVSKRYTLDILHEKPLVLTPKRFGRSEDLGMLRGFSTCAA